MTNSIEKKTESLNVRASKTTLKRVRELSNLSGKIDTPTGPGVRNKKSQSDIIELAVEELYNRTMEEQYDRIFNCKGQ
jgi:hypothetical protein